MGHRHLVNAPQLPEMDHAQICNHPYSDPHLHLENGSYGLPVNVSVTGVSPMPRVNTGSRIVDYPSSSLSTEFPNYRTINSGISHNYHLHNSSAGIRRFPANVIEHGPSFNSLNIGDESGVTNSHINDGRTAFKRKNPSFGSVFEGGHAHGYYSAPSSSNSHFLEPRPIPFPQCRPWNSVDMVPVLTNDSLSTARDEFHRNVRSRHGHAVHLENSLSSAYQPDNLPPYVNLNGYSTGHGTAEELRHTHASFNPSSRRILFSGTSSSNHDMNQSLPGNSVAHGAVGINGAFHTNLVQNTNPTAPALTASGPSARAVGPSRGSYGQRTSVYRPVSSYPSMVLGSTSVEAGMHSGAEAIASSRHSRSLSIMEHSRERNDRARNYYDRLHSFFNEDNLHGRWASEGPVMLDHSTFYDSMEWFDQHRGMRLDIDSMSYEELLALEERIGSVSTGLSEGTISRCLIETTYCSSQVEEKCVICLEEFEDGDLVGRLKCGHDFHVACIRKWLSIKNACPICKSAALSDTSKEKQIVTS